MNLEIKYNSGTITEYKEFTRNGVPVGIVKGYIATWDIDRGNDQFVKGAFAESLNEYRTKGRQIRLKDHHGRTVGGFPIDRVYEDDKGLFGEGEINLDTQQGAELYSLVKQGVVTDYSIGYSTDLKDIEFKDNIRVIKKAVVWEGSLVDEPMNPNANITEVKAISRETLPKQFAESCYKWNNQDAEKRLREWAEIEDEPNEKYKSAFLWIDQENADLFDSYKYQILDVIEGEIKIIPRAVFAVRAALSGAHKNSMTEPDTTKIKGVINELYLEMDMEKPFNGENIKSFCMTELKGLSMGDLRRVIQKCELSKDAAVFVASALADRVMITDTGVSAAEEKAINELYKKIFEVK